MLMLKAAQQNGHEGVSTGRTTPTVRNPYETLSILVGKRALEAQGTRGRRAFQRLQRRGSSFGAVAAFAGTGEP